MARYQITMSDEQLHGLLQGDRGLADLPEAVLNQVLQAQAAEHLKAEPYERTEERVGYRNGASERPITTRVGRLTLEVPQFRQGKLKETSWRDFFKWLKGRGLAGVDLVVSDDHEGLVNAVAVEL